MLSELLPWLVTVTVFAALVVPTASFPNVRLVGLRVTTVPIPLTVTFWGLPPPLSLTLNVPVRVPIAVGVKNTLVVHDAPIAVSIRTATGMNPLCNHRHGDPKHDRRNPCTQNS